jgi:octaprenyl-diphosphate synthase
MTLTGITDLIKNDLMEVNRRFKRELCNDLSCVNTLVDHVERFTGKQLRPTLLLLCARATGRVCDAVYILATVMEMIHISTLVHDDVLDEAEMRRKGATLNHLKGNEAAVMLGDYIVSQSFRLCASIDDSRACRIIAEATNRVCEGELLQIHNRNNFNLDEKTYFDIISRKTASLIAVSCRLGALYGGATEKIAHQLHQFGHNLGVAFQIQDDILDIVGDPSVVGKTLGIDIEKGKLTLPMIHFRETAPRQHRELLLSLLKSNEPDRVDQVCNLILPSASLDYAREKARQYIDAAIKSLDHLPDSAALQALHGIAGFVIDRAL